MSIIIISLINGIVFGFCCCLASYAILQKKEIVMKNILWASIIFLVMHYCVLCLLDSIYSIFFSGLCSFWFIKMIFNETIYMSLFISTIIHTMKVLFKIIILNIFYDKSFLLINTYKTLTFETLYIDVVAIILAVSLIFFQKDLFRKILIYISELKRRQYILLVAIYFGFILVIMFQPPYNLFSLQTVTDLLMIFTVTGIGIFNISSERKMEVLTKHYQEMFEYSKTSGELLSSYKMQVHENKNKLLMIRGMLDCSKKDIQKYIDNILQEIDANKNSVSYWSAELRYINSAGIRNFINCKLIQLKKKGAKIEVFVSSELENIDITLLNEKEYSQLTTILGVILDNMIDSIINTDKKLISLNIYIENGEVHGEFVNTFSGEIDLNRLNEIGYTTKCEQHGVGLSLVTKIIKKNSRFECTPSIMDDFFIQHLIIKIRDKKNLQKISKK